MFIKKEIKYGYPVETAGVIQIVKPSNLTSIHLTPANKKFVFHGTRQDILKWMVSHSELLVEYDPFDDETTFLPSPPSSPLFPAYAEVLEIYSSSPTSISFNLSHDITFDLFTTPVKPSEVSEDSTFFRPLNIALKAIPRLEFTLEIRLTNEHIDSELYPVHRVILPSGSSLFEVSKALEKSWKINISNQTAFSPDYPIKNNELLNQQKKRKLVSDNEIIKEVEDRDVYSNKFMTEIAKRVPTVDLWLRQKQTSGTIPPGILTPYIIDDVLEELNRKEEEEVVNEQIISDKKKEARNWKKNRKYSN